MSPSHYDKAIRQLVELRVDPAIIQNLRSQLQRAVPQSRLTIGIRETVSDSSTWPHNRLAWWPNGIPAGKRIGLVSSRLGHGLDTKQSWFTLLRAVCTKVSKNDVLLSSEATAPAQFVERCAQLFNLPLLRIQASETNAKLSEWIDDIDAKKVEKSTSRFDVYLSPSLNDTDVSGPTDIPLRDRALITLSDQLYALHIRKDGNLHQLIQARLDDPRFSDASVYVALGHGLSDDRVARELMDQGAIGWHILDGDQDHGESTDCSQINTNAAPIIPVPRGNEWPYLAHCTRRRKGPWPDQDDEAFLDDLILSRDSADHSPLAALMRIINQKRIIASSEGIRGEAAVVSFTAVPFVELGGMRTFRSHRSRWDFEPYGICILREWLESRNARQAIYGDENTWEKLTSAKRPFFQLAQTNTAAGNTIDWTTEREWRVEGDFDLDEVPVDAAIIFVKTRYEAERIAPLSPWPVTHLE